MPIKNTVYNALRLGNNRDKQVKKTEGLYGVEIEAEGYNLPPAIPGIWRLDEDGSLKSGLQGGEYVMPLPLSLKGVKESLETLNLSYKNYGTKVVETDTSGVHVHVNVQDLTMKQLFTFATLYLVFEELLLTYCGESRIGNHFCLRAKDAEAIIHVWANAATTQLYEGLNTEDNRYASLNPLSLFKYGSLEFRAMRGTGDLDAIYRWVEIIDVIRKKSLDFASPREVVLSMSMDGEMNFIKQVLGDMAIHFNKVKGRDKMLRDGARIVQPLAFIPDWDKYKDVKNNPFA